MTNNINVPFEGKVLTLNLPPGWKVIASLGPNPMPRLDDVRSALLRGLENPVGCGALGEVNLSDKKIAIAVDDASRPTPTHLYFRYILDYLFERGAKKENILIIAAIGTHRFMTQDELEKKLGRKNIEGLKWINHNCKDLSGHAALGTTKRGTKVFLNKRLKDADLILCLGLIGPHPLLGFGGGLKMILPGLAHEETVAHNHMQGVSGGRFNYIGAHDLDSPMRLDLEEAASMLDKRIFVVDAILNQDLEICRFVCGDGVETHREGIKTVASISTREIKEQADAAIVLSNPMNTDLRQGIKCIANVERSVRKDGLILALLECKYGIGDIAAPRRPPALNYELFRLALKLLGSGGIFWLSGKVKKGAALEERFLANFSMQVARKNRIFIYSNNLPEATDKKVKLFRQFADLEEMLEAASRYAPREAKIYVYPYGGVTYPVLA